MKKYPISQILMMFLFCFAISLLLPQPACAQEGGMVEALTVVPGKAGFCPGKGKSMQKKAQENNKGAAATKRIRIYNNKGK